MEDGIKDGFLTIEDGKIKAFSPKSAALTADKDFSRYRIIPGVVDTHNHGSFGYSLAGSEEFTEKEAAAYLKGLAATGVTAVLPTTTNLEVMKLLVDNKDKLLDGARICGIHSEGPWGNRVGEKGINTGYPAIDMDHAKKMIEVCQGMLKLVDIAPELEGAHDMIRFLVSQGINVGIYHTNANFEEANAGIDAGITVATHLGNVMTGLHHRDIGTLGACLFRDEVDCEVICDDLHLSLEIVRLYFKVKDYSRFMMVSDNVHYAGAPAGRYKGMTTDEKSDRIRITVTKEGFVLSETGRLSGSSLPVMYGIKNLVQKLDIPLETVVLMSSLNPAKKYGFGDRKGSLKIGKDADFAVVTTDFDVVKTYCEGRLVYDKYVDTDLFNPDYLDEFLLEKF